MHYRALGTAYNYLNGGTQRYWDSVYDGVGKLRSMILDEEAHCPSEKLVLAGYSQGALVVHITLRKLTVTNPDAITSSHIAAVLMLADPGKVRQPAETTWELDPSVYANYPAGAGVTNANGIWTRVSGADSGPLPSTVTARTLAMCHNHDIVCAPGLGATLRQHTGYDSSEQEQMGIWGAETYLGLPHQH